jgi:hypothetical protein
LEALIVLAIRVAAIAGFFLAVGARSRLSLVESRLAALKTQIPTHGDLS